MTLFQINLNVRLKPAHPVATKSKGGLLCVFMYAASPREASTLACELVDRLPYKRCKGVSVARVRRSCVQGEAAIQTAKLVGVGLFLVVLDKLPPEFEAIQTPLSLE